MKSLYTLVGLLLVGLLAAHTATAQTESDVPQNAATINYTVGDLEKLDKLELTSIYIAKITRLQDILPYIPFHTLEPKKPNDLRIPATGSNEKALAQLDKDRADYNETMRASLNGIVPYANKDDLIGAIIFVQGFINKVELIGLGMNDLGY